MKLFHKIFLCFVVIFGITFQAAGYLLINFSYENAIEQEKEIAFQDFKYNQYILQSILYSDIEFILKEKNESILRNFTVPVNLYGRSGIDVFAITGIPMFESKVTHSHDPYRWEIYRINEEQEEQEEQVFFKYDYTEEGADERISFQTYEEDGKCYIFVFGCVEQGNNKVYMVTQTDISSSVDNQKRMIAYFQRIYIIIFCISFPIIFLLTKALTASLKKVGEGAGRIARGDYSQRIHMKGKDEIGELATDFNRMTAQVEEKMAELSDMARQKEDFTANFAHELKTPMTSVIGYADMLYQRDLPREEVKSAAGYILDEGMRLEALSLKLMDLFVLDRQDFFLEKMSVEEMFENMKQGIEPICRKYDAALHMEIEEDSIRVDFDLFKTMILNLADNAAKADSRDLWITGKRGRDCYRIEIRDNGKGIPPEELGKITEAFYMVDKSRARKQHGAGLGMALVAKIVEIHGAKMKIESDGKTGTTVRVVFDTKEGGSDEQNV